jgi:DnaJ-domain-containing protein 1
VDRFFDKLGDILKDTVGGSGDDLFSRSRQGSRGTGNPDLDAAFEELDEFLKTGKNEERPQSSNGYQGQTEPPRRPAGPPEVVVQAYAELKLPVNAELAQVKAQYKSLLKQYHPDKNADNPEKLRVATEITQKINVAYQVIEKWKETGRL